MRSKSTDAITSVASFARYRTGRVSKLLHPTHVFSSHNVFTEYAKR